MSRNNNFNKSLIAQCFQMPNLINWRNKYHKHQISFKSFKVEFKEIKILFNWVNRIGKMLG